MSYISDHYRNLANEARRTAEATLLPRVRMRHLQSAFAFDEMVSRIERTEANKARNDGVGKG